MKMSLESPSIPPIPVPTILIFGGLFLIFSSCTKISGNGISIDVIEGKGTLLLVIGILASFIGIVIYCAALWAIISIESKRKILIISTFVSVILAFFTAQTPGTSPPSAIIDNNNNDNNESDIIIGNNNSCIIIPYNNTTQTPTNTKITITSPLNTAQIRERIEGIARNIPEGQELWIVIYPHIACSYYPIGKAHIQDEKWSLPAQFGESKDVGTDFDVIAVLADSKAQEEINAYFETCEMTMEWPGMDKIPDSAEEYDRVTVTRV